MRLLGLLICPVVPLLTSVVLAQNQAKSASVGSVPAIPAEKGYLVQEI
jgi:hypothetical protein